MAIEIFTHNIPEWMLRELKQAEDDLRNLDHPNGFIPWALFGPKNGKDADMMIFTRLTYFPKGGKKDD